MSLQNHGILADEARLEGAANDPFSDDTGAILVVYAGVKQLVSLTLQDLTRCAEGYRKLTCEATHFIPAGTGCETRGRGGYGFTLRPQGRIPQPHLIPWIRGVSIGPRRIGVCRSSLCHFDAASGHDLA
jgi:hypothetical protein